MVDCRHDPQDIAVFGPLLMIHSKHYLNDLRDDALIEETCELANRPVRKGGIAWRGAREDNYMCSYFSTSTRPFAKIRRRLFWFKTPQAWRVWATSPRVDLLIQCK